jgi:hypothetical protein
MSFMTPRLAAVSAEHFRSTIDRTGALVVGVNGGTIARQCLELGLLDEIWLDLVPSCSEPVRPSSTT